MPQHSLIQKSTIASTDSRHSEKAYSPCGEQSRIEWIETEDFLQRTRSLGSLLTDSTLQISKARYLELVMEEWRTFLQAQKRDIMATFNKYDENGDGVMTLNEFTILMKDLEPSVSPRDSANLFMRVSSISARL